MDGKGERSDGSVRAGPERCDRYLVGAQRGFEGGAVVPLKAAEQRDIGAHESRPVPVVAHAVRAFVQDDGAGARPARQLDHLARTAGVPPAAAVAEARRAPGPVPRTRLFVPAKDLFDQPLAGAERELAAAGRGQDCGFPGIDPLPLEIARALLQPRRPARASPGLGLRRAAAEQNEKLTKHDCSLSRVDITCLFYGFWRFRQGKLDQLRNRFPVTPLFRPGDRHGHAR